VTFIRYQYSPYCMSARALPPLICATCVSLISCPTRTPTDPSRALPSQTRPDRGRPAHMAGGPPSPCAHKRRWGLAALINQVDRTVHPTNTQTLADLVVRRSQRRDCSPSAPRRRPTPPPSPVSAVGDPKVAGISSEPLPVPPRHRQSPW
jgi:hypothetical protein